MHCFLHKNANSPYRTHFHRAQTMVVYLQFTTSWPSIDGQAAEASVVRQVKVTVAELYVVTSLRPLVFLADIND